MTLQELIDQLTDLVQNRPELRDVEVVLGGPGNADEVEPWPDMVWILSDGKESV